jgi:predicted ATPase
MIKSIKLKNFKCYKEQLFKLNKLVVFCGGNSVGKSTAIQSILLMLQNKFSLSLKLDGDYIELGTFSDIHNVNAESDSILLEINIDNDILSWGYEDNQLHGKIGTTTDESPLPLSSSIDRKSAEIISTKFFKKYENDFIFLCAERLGPRNNYPYSNQRSSKNWLGAHGEYTAQVLANLIEAPQSLEEADPRRHINSLSKLVFDNFVCWMQEISPGAFVKVDSIPHANISTNQFMFDGHSYRAINVGFGLSYALPVVIALIMSKPGSLVIIENPEAHLHPKGQSYIGRLIALATIAGVQVIIETHSDHLLNGIRVVTRTCENFDPELFTLYYVSQGNEQSNVEEITITKDGKLSNWPNGFFDQQAQDMYTIVTGKNQYNDSES